MTESVVKIYTEIARFPDIQGKDFLFVQRWRGTRKDNLVVSAKAFPHSIPEWGWIHGTKRGWFDLHDDVPEMQDAIDQYFWKQTPPAKAPDALMQWIWQEFTFGVL